ncbi:MAG TPA: hypothetical protein VNM14_10315 [Planctomycetota bacterium]|jgi:hypothetical protein|nr:hypothetical protein [Planctomycetota bacterium]
MTADPRRCAVCGVPLRPSQSGSATCASASCRRAQRLRPPRRCSYCTREALPAEETCADPRCRQLRVENLDARRASAERRVEVQRNLLRHEQELRAQQPLPERVLLARLPANERGVVPLPEERRATFATNLRAAIDRALDDPDRPVPESPEDAPAQAPLIRGACSACRGSCCTSGGEHAFLYPDHFRRFLRNHPERSRDELLADYLSRVPPESVQDSCVYHRESGCALPRELRANLCNSFLCGDLTELLEARSRQADPPPTLACCVRSFRTEIVRSVVLGPSVTAGTAHRT